MPYDTDKIQALSNDFLNYAKTLGDADNIRLAAHLLGLANAVQQHACIPKLAAVASILFADVEKDDTVDPGYYLHNMLEDMADELDMLAVAMDA